MKSIVYRPLEARDADAYQKLRLQGLQQHPEAFCASWEIESTYSGAQVAERIRHDGGRVVLGGFRDGQLVAVCGLLRESAPKLKHKAFIWGMYVSPGTRGEGVGSALLQAAIDHAKNWQGLRQVYLSVEAGNQSALGLYRKTGFVEYGREPDFLFVDGRFHDEIMLLYRL